MTTHTYNTAEDDLPVFPKSEGGGDDDLPVFKPAAPDESVKKKEAQDYLLTGLKKVASLAGLLPSSTEEKKPESQNDKIKQYVTGETTTPHNDVPVITNAITQKPIKKTGQSIIKPVDENVDKEAKSTINNIMYGEGKDWKDPLGAIDKKVKQAKNIDEFTALNHAGDLTIASLAPSGYDAKHALENGIWGSEDNKNLTANVLRHKAQQYDNDVSPLRNIQFSNSEDYNADQLKNAAIIAQANKDEGLKNQIESSGLSLNDPNLWMKVGREKSGQLLDEYLQNPNVHDFLTKEDNNPVLAKAFQHADNNLLKDSGQYGVAKVAGELSRHLQKIGVNDADPIFNVDTQQSRDIADARAKQLFIDDPKKLEYYEAHKDEVLASLDKPSFFEGVAGGIKNVFGGIGNLDALWQSRSKDIQDQWTKEATNVSADPEGLIKHIRNSGSAVGFVLGLGAGGEVLQGAKLASTPAAAQKAMIGMSVFGDALKEGEMKYKSPVKAYINAGVNALGMMVMSDIFPAAKIGKVFNQAKPELTKVAEQLSSGEITKEVAREQAATTISNAIDWGKKALKQNVTASAEWTTLTAVKQGMDKIMGLDQQSYDKYNKNDLGDTFGSFFLSNALVSGFVASGGSKSREMENKVFEAANFPQRYEQTIDAMKVKDPSIDADQMKDNLKFITEVKSKLDADGIDPINQKRFLTEALKEKVNKENIANVPESAKTRQTQKEIEQSQQVQDKILNGEDVVGDEIKAGLSPQENSVIDAIKEKTDLAKEPDGSMGKTIYDAVQDPNNHKQVINELVDQSSDPEALEMNVGKKVTDAVLELPQKSEQKTPEQLTDENKSQATEASPESNEPPKAEQPGEATLSIEGEQNPPEPPTEAKPVAEGEEDKEATSIKNEFTRQQRESLGLRNEIPAAEKEFGKTWDEAKEKIAAGTDPQDLVNELKKKARPLTDVENALLLHHQNTKEIQLNDTNEQINKAAESGNEGDLAEAKVRKARLLDELQDIYDVNKAVGTENARGLASRKMMTDRQYSLTNMLAEKRATANDGKPLTEDQQKEVEVLHQKITETQQAFDDYVKEAQEEIGKLQEKILGKPVKDKKSAAQKIRDLADKIEKSKFGKADLPGGTETQGASFDLNKAIADGMRLIADGLEKGKELLDLIKESVENFKKDNPGEDYAKYRQSLNKSLIDASITVDKKTIKEDYSGIVHDKEAFKLRAANQRAKNEADISLKKDEQKKRTTSQKVQDTFIKWQRAFKLSNPLTLGKLSMAALTRMTTDPLEQAVGGAYSSLFPKLSEGSSEGGGLNVKVQAKAMAEGFTQGMKDAADIMKKKSQGKSDLDVVFGKGSQLPPEAIEFFGSLHSAIKAPVKRFAFERSLQKRIARNIKANVDVHDPMVQTQMAMGAYKDANRAIFMQDNAVATGWQRMVHYFETVDPKTGKAPAKAVATGMQWMLPFVKVPTNIASEIGTNIYGVPVGAAKGLHAAFTKGLENLSPDEKDVILRNLKKGTLGLAALSLGYMNPQVFGGYYQEKEKRGTNEAKPNSVKLFGVNIPAWLVESPIFQAMEIGATVRRVKDTVIKGSPKGITEGAIAGALGLAEHVPMIGQGIRINKLFSNATDRKYYVGELAKSTLIPAALDYIAKATDPADEGTIAGKALNPENKRKPETILEHIESGIPGLRENVPLKNHSPFTEEDKKNSSFKYFLDKGLELPNTIHTSEEITDERAKTKKKLSDYPQDIQDKYDAAHKEILSQELKRVLASGHVFVKEYKDAKGEQKNQVSLTHQIYSKRKPISGLSQEELIQVLHLSQSEATKKTKKKIFKTH